MISRADLGGHWPDEGAKLAFAVAFVAAGFTLLLQWPGVVLSPDGWAYWEGSISLLNGDGYRYFGGQPLTLWPAGFSLYLALWQALFGNSAGTLACAHATATGAAAGLWVAAAFAMSGRRSVGFRSLALALVFALAVPIASRRILSESLFLAFFAGALLVAARGSRESSAAPFSARRETARALLLAAAVAALLLTRYVAAAFLPALFWLYFVSARDRLSPRALRALAGAGAVVVFALLSRALLGQVHARIELDGSAPGRVAENLLVNLLAAANSLIPGSPAGAVATVAVCALLYLGLRALRWPASTPAMRAGGRSRSGLGGATALAAACGGAAFALYGVTGTRFVLPIVALLLLLIAEQTERAKRPGARRVAAALLGCLALVQLARGAYWTRYSLVEAPPGIAWDTRIVPGCRAEEPACILAPDEIAPPDFPWIDRGFDARAAPGAPPR